jgi:hypothetical protein
VDVKSQSRSSVSTARGRTGCAIGARAVSVKPSSQRGTGFQALNTRHDWLRKMGSASDHRAFADLLFKLQAHGARTIAGAHHSPKAFESKEAITLENALRGSGDVGAMLATCWAVKQINADSNRLHLKNVKARDFEPCKPFELEGRPWIDQTGSFKMTAPPGSASLPSQNSKVQKWELARALRRQGKTLAEIAIQLDVFSVDFC